MAESKAQKIARLKNEINMAEDSARITLERAERKREKLALLSNRPGEPEGDMLAVRVRYRTNAIQYNYLIVKTSRGYFTTGTGDKAFFHSWDNMLDWLDGDDIAWHSGIEVLTGTGEVAFPARASDYFDG